MQEFPTCIIISAPVPVHDNIGKGHTSMGSEKWLANLLCVVGGSFPFCVHISPYMLVKSLTRFTKCLGDFHISGQALIFCLKPQQLSETQGVGRSPHLSANNKSSAFLI